jgi:putative CocE/NonD family hydrolase
MTNDVHMQWGVQIPMRDGVRLNATLYLPEDLEAPSAALFTLTPYVGQTYHERGMYFASHGYPFLTVDVRGRGNSEGCFKPFINEGKDGHDVVEWLVQQPYCNGSVGMWGGSYGGYDQWMTARERPPHLKTIVPVAPPYIGVDYPIRYNIASPYLMQWLTLTAGRTGQDRIFFEDQPFFNRKFRQWFERGAAFKDLDTFMGQPSAVFQEWLAHPEQSGYWDAYNPTSEDYARLELPILTITGCYDGDQPGALMHYREYLRAASAEARARIYLIMGPWDHAGTRTPRQDFVGLTMGPASVVDLQQLHLEWYAWTLKDGPRPAFLEKPVAVYVMGADRWRYADTLEQITARHQPYYLHSVTNPTDVFHSGELRLEPPEFQEHEPDHYVHDPLDVSLAALESTIDPETRADQQMVYAAIGKQLVYHSTPFTKSTELSGFFKLVAWLAIDQPDTDLRATVYEIHLDGRSTLLTFATLRARYREGLRTPKLISTSEPLRYDFDTFMFTSREVSAGSRLRLVLGPLHSIYSQKNYNAGGVVAEESGEDARPVTVQLFHDHIRPSALYVPLGRPG